MREPLRLTTALHQRGPAGAIVLTDDQVAQLGGGAKTFPVAVTVNGTTLRLRVARMGGENLIGFSKAARAEAGVEIDQQVDVEITVDDSPRTVDVPEDLAAALAVDPQVRATFDGLAPSHRKEFVRWVTEAKRETTRSDRIAKTVEMVSDGRTRRP